MPRRSQKRTLVSGLWDSVSDFRVRGLGFGVWGSGFVGLEFGVWGLEFWGLGFGFCALGFGCWGLEFGGLGLESEVYRRVKGHAVDLFELVVVVLCTCIGRVGFQTEMLHPTRGDPPQGGRGRGRRTGLLQAQGLEDEPAAALQGYLAHKKPHFPLEPP